MKTISKLFLLLSIILLSSCDETELDQTVTNQVNPQKEEDSRIVFNSAKEFYNTLDTLPRVLNIRYIKTLNFAKMKS